MNSFSNIPEYQKPEFMRYLEDEQMRESLKYASFHEHNFGLCEILLRIILLGCIIDWLRAALQNVLQ